MPLYEYACHDCRHQFETIRSMSQADSPHTCPYCHSDHVRRLISKVLAVTKGGSSTEAYSAPSMPMGGCCGGGCGCH